MNRAPTNSKILLVRGSLGYLGTFSRNHSFQKAQKEARVFDAAYQFCEECILGIPERPDRKRRACGGNSRSANFKKNPELKVGFLCPDSKES